MIESVSGVQTAVAAIDRGFDKCDAANIKLLLKNTAGKTYGDYFPYHEVPPETPMETFLRRTITDAAKTAYQAAQSGRDIGEAMRTFGLAPLAELPGQYLSAGQKRRLALARLQLSARPLWLLDEPLAALDAAGKKLVAETVAAHCASGGIVVAATHEELGVECETLRLGAAR